MAETNLARVALAGTASCFHALAVELAALAEAGIPPSSRPEFVEGWMLAVMAHLRLMDPTIPLQESRLQFRKIARRVSEQMTDPLATHMAASLIRLMAAQESTRS